MASKRVTITLDEEVIDKVKESAKNEGRTVSNFIAQILKSFFKSKK